MIGGRDMLQEEFEQGIEVNRHSLNAIGIHQLSAEVSLGLRSPVTIRAGEVYEGELKEQLVRLYNTQAYNAAVIARKE